MKVIDFFAGCGGLSLGFQQAGFNVIAAYDNCPNAVKIYRDNFKHPIFKVDLSIINQDLINQVNNLNPDIIIGGPPCQDFSSAGKRDETLGRADLTLTFARYISLLKPSFFIMENVDRIIKSNIFIEAVKIFKESNYGISFKVLNASNYGVPQSRKRLFLIGNLGSEDNFFEDFWCKFYSEKQTTLFDYFGNSLGVEHYYRHPRSYLRRAVFSIHEPSPTIRGVNRPIPENYKSHSGDSCIINNNVRPLTTKERSLIQTFPESFKFEGSKTNLETAIGNAVPVNLAKLLALSLKMYIAENSNK